MRRNALTWKHIFGITLNPWHGAAPWRGNIIWKKLDPWRGATPCHGNLNPRHGARHDTETYFSKNLNPWHGASPWRGNMNFQKNLNPWRGAMPWRGNIFWKNLESKAWRTPWRGNIFLKKLESMPRHSALAWIHIFQKLESMTGRNNLTWNLCSFHNIDPWQGAYNNTLSWNRKYGENLWAHVRVHVEYIFAYSQPMARRSYSGCEKKFSLKTTLRSWDNQLVEQVGILTLDVILDDSCILTQDHEMRQRITTSCNHVHIWVTSLGRKNLEVKR